MIIRPETTADEQAIHQVLLAAFPGPGEAQLVSMLRQHERLSYAWVAEGDDQIVGFIGFSPLTLEGRPCKGLGLAPLAVAPASQRQGSVDLLVVLGDPAYYAPFGFQPAARWNLADQYGGGDAFQALPLRPGGVPQGGGLVQYAPEFAQLGE